MSCYYSYMMIGTLYDGTRKRLEGNGPSMFTPALDAELKFKSMLYDSNCVRKGKSRLTSNDRLWALPNDIDLNDSKIYNIIINLVNKVKVGNRVGLASSNENVLKLVRDYISNAIKNLS